MISRSVGADCYARPDLDLRLHIDVPGEVGRCSRCLRGRRWSGSQAQLLRSFEHEIEASGRDVDDGLWHGGCRQDSRVHIRGGSVGTSSSSSSWRLDYLKKEIGVNKGEEDRLWISPVTLLVCCRWRSRGGGLQSRVSVTLGLISGGPWLVCHWRRRRRR